MNTKSILVGALITSLAFAAWTPAAHAGGNKFPLAKLLAHGGKGSHGFPIARALARAGKGNRSFPIANALMGSGRHGRGGWDGFGWQGGDSGNRGDWGNRGHYDYPEAIRDVAITNAVAGVITSLIAGSMANAPAPYAYAPSAYSVTPPPVAIAPSQPLGRYETQRLPLRDGRQEIFPGRAPESIPEQMDPRPSGQTNENYEMRQRWVPETEEQQVRVRQ